MAELSLPPRPDERETAKSQLRTGTWEERQAKASVLVDDALTRIGDSLAAGHSEGLHSFLTTMGRFHHYSLTNQILIAIQNPAASHVAGFHAWKSFERTVRPGEKGIVVMAPVTKKVGEREEVEEDGTKRTEAVRRVVNVKPVYVFDIAQTEGKELPKLYKTEGESGIFLDRLAETVRADGIEILISSSLGAALGVSEGKRIRLSSSLDGAQQFRVLTHEYAHELLHRGEDREQITRRTRELEAECVACVVCAAIGIDTTQSSTDYVHLYRGTKESLESSLKQIRQAAGIIIKALTE